MMYYLRLYPLWMICLLPACKPAPTTQPRTPAKNDISFPIEDFNLTERSGKKISKSDLLGKVWIASFIFTRCTGTCPQVTTSMTRLQSMLENEADVRLVTFTVDPSRDDPNELRKYAENRHADKDRWLFLTGQEKEIHRLLKESFKIPVARNDKAKEPSDEFDHSTRLVLVDRKGNVRGYFQGIADPATDESGKALEESLQRLKERVEELLREKP